MPFLVNRMKQGIVRYTGYGTGDCGADSTGQPGMRELDRKFSAQTFGDKMPAEWRLAQRACAEMRFI